MVHGLVMIAIDNFILLRKHSKDPECPPIVTLSPTLISGTHVAEKIITPSGAVLINATTL